MKEIISKIQHLVHTLVQKIVNQSMKVLNYLKSIKLSSRQLHLFTIVRQVAFLVMFLVISFYFMVSGVPALREHFVKEAQTPVTDTIFTSEKTYEKYLVGMRRQLATVERRFNALTSGQNYLVVNTTDNRFYLYRNKLLVREGFCSSGSYINLKTHDEREWIFRTPKGRFRIQGKTTYPVWRKPDWAFIEEGLPVPPPGHPSRFEYGSLGDYALSLGDGYLIHGTIYKRSLGMPVTHGCIRMNDDDLEFVFNSLNVGSKVYIY